MPLENDPNILELQARIEFLEEKVMNGIEAVRENQERMCFDISKIKEAVYNPDTGLYARLRDLEQSQQSTHKMVWMVITVVVGTIGAYLANLAI